MKTQLDKVIGSKLSSDNTLCIDAWRAFSTYAKSKGLEHYRFKSDGTERVKGLYHIQNVNDYHSRLKRWMQRFNGVATKYLQNYLVWFAFLDSVHFKTDGMFIKQFLVESCVHPMTETNRTLRKKKFVA